VFDILKIILMQKTSKPSATVAPHRKYKARRLKGEGHQEGRGCCHYLCWL